MKLLGNVHVPKPVPNLCMSCVQAWALLVHWSYCLDTPCTLLGHSLYTTQVLLGHSLYTAQVPLGYSLRTTQVVYTWVLLVHIQYNDLGTLSTLGGYCFSTPGTLELHAWVFLANKLPLACAPLVHYLKSYTCALSYKM